jgi:hypothetical protein
MTSAVQGPFANGPDGNQNGRMSGTGVRGASGRFANRPYKPWKHEQTF